MSNNYGNGPDLDYEELRRRHEEFKARKRFEEQPAVNARAEARPQRKAAPAEDVIEVRRAEVAAPAPETQPADEAEYYEDDYPEQDYADEGDYEQPQSDNPFASFLKMARNVKGKVRAKKARREDEFEDDRYEDDQYADDYPDEQYPDDAPAEAKPQGVPAGENVQNTPAGDAQAEDIQAEDIQAEPPRSGNGRRARYADDPDRDEADAYDENGEYDEAYDEEYDEEVEKPRRGGFKKFVNLFVKRVDDQEEEPLYDDADEYGDVYDDEVDSDRPEDEYTGVVEENVVPAKPVNAAQPKPEGGLFMEEPRKVAAANTVVPAEPAGMSRRERRELAERLAAEEAARAAAEQAAKAAEEQAKSAESLFAEPVAEKSDAEPAAEEPKVDMNAFAAAAAEPVIESVAKDISEEAEEPTREFAPVEAAEEPTREFRPVSHSVQETDDLFAMSENTDSKGFDDDFGDAEDEDEPEEEKPRRGLFGHRRKHHDEDDVEEEDDQFEDDEDEEAPRSRRDRKARRNRDIDEDDEFEDDAEDEEFDEEEDDRRHRKDKKRGKRRYDDDDDDEDEYDEYDEYEDDEDDLDEDEEDDYYDDDEDEGRSFGHHMVGILMALLGVILAALIALIVLNFVYISNGSSFVEKLHDRYGNTKAFEFLFPSYKVRVEVQPTQEQVETTTLDEIEALPDVAQESTVSAQPEVSIPTFTDNNTATTGDPFATGDQQQ